MTQEYKDLLLKDLCARLPYDVVVRCYFVDGGGEEVLDTDDIADLLYNEENGEFPMYKPYLRPMSSMTEEERKEVENLIKENRPSPYGIINNKGIDNLLFSVSVTSGVLTNWLNAHHFDYRNLIERGLAIEVTEENNPYKE